MLGVCCGESELAGECANAREDATEFCAAEGSWPSFDASSLKNWLKTPQAMGRRLVGVMVPASENDNFVVSRAGQKATRNPCVTGKGGPTRASGRLDSWWSE